MAVPVNDILGAIEVASMKVEWLQSDTPTADVLEDLPTPGQIRLVRARQPRVAAVSAETFPAGLYRSVVMMEDLGELARCARAEVHTTTSAPTQPVVGIARGDLCDGTSVDERLINARMAALDAQSYELERAYGQLRSDAVYGQV